MVGISAIWSACNSLSSKGLGQKIRDQIVTRQFWFVLVIFMCNFPYIGIQFFAWFNEWLYTVPDSDGKDVKALKEFTNFILDYNDWFFIFCQTVQAIFIVGYIYTDKFAWKIVKGKIKRKLKSICFCFYPAAKTTDDYMQANLKSVESA